MLPDVNLLSSPSETVAFHQSFESVIEHWAKVRIEGPVDTISRYDEAAKQLITLGGLLQGIYVAAFAFGDVSQRIALWLLLPMFVPILTLIFCAARAVCTIFPQMQAYGVYKLFQSGLPRGLDSAALDKAIEEWCHSVDSTARTKRAWLHVANTLFFASSLLTVVLLGLAMFM
jgi:hypothetical protein